MAATLPILWFLAQNEGAADPEYQPYIFWAYSLACVLLFAFTAYSIQQTKTLAARIEYLRERVDKASVKNAPKASDEG